MKTIRISEKNRAKGIPRVLMSIIRLWCITQPINADTFEDFQYTDNGPGITIEYYLGSGDEFGAVVIPDTIIGKPVTRIDDYSFRGRNEVTSVLIPGTVTTIGDFAFADCGNLTGVTIPEGVIGIGESAFSDCSGLTSVTLPGSVTSIGKWAFTRCGLTSVTVAGGVTNIVEWTFGECDQLEIVTILSGVKSIEDRAFAYCGGLTTVIMPDSVASIGVWAFERCTALTTFSVDDANPHFSSAGGVLFDKAKTLVIRCPAGMSGIYMIQASVSFIGELAFFDCDGLTGVTIPSGVTAIGEGAFNSCDGLANMIIPASVSSIGTSALANCSGLISIAVETDNPKFSSMDGVLFDQTESLLIQYPAGIGGDYVIPGSVTQIGDGAFAGCGRPPGSDLPVGLTGITIPDSVTSIGKAAFSGCNRLTSITLPAGVTRIEDFTFLDCNGLTVVTIPSGLTHIGAGAFGGCGYAWDPEQPGGLTGITIPDSVTSIGDGAFSGCNRLTSVTIPSGVTRIADRTFSYCTALESVIIPHGVTSIGEGAFFCGDSWWGNETPVGLMSVTIPDTVITIGNYAFSGCNRLKGVTIPDSVTSIGYSAFQGCRSLTSLDIPDSVTSVGREAFSHCSGLMNVMISSNLTSLEERLFYECTALEDVIIPSGVTSIGDEAFSCGENWWADTPPVGITSITIPETVSSIGNSAFSGCNRLTSVTIPESVVSIGYAAFQGCRNLTGIEIPGSIIHLGPYAFFRCSGLNSISVAESNANYCSSDGVLYNKPKTMLIQCPAGFSGFHAIPEGVVSIGDDAFYDCSNMTGVNIPDSVTTIGDAAFLGCGGLTSIDIPPEVSRIGHSMFLNCSGLTSITIPPGVTDIGMQAFWGCSGLVGMEIPASVTNIGESVFYQCSSLMSISVDDANPNFSSLNGVLFNKDRTSLIQFPTGMVGTYVIPAGVKSIESRAFAGSVGLTIVSISAFVTDIKSVAFDGCSGLTQVTIPSSVTSIGSSAFQQCASLTSALFSGNAPSMDWGVFDLTANDFTVYYFSGRTGFTSPTWLGYPAVAMDPAPMVVTGLSSGITAKSAMLLGTVNPNGASTIAQFEYGLTSAYERIAGATLWPNNGTNSVSVTASVNGLQPGQLYHYRLTATNPSGTGFGEDMTLTTHPALTVIAMHGVVLPASGQYSPGTVVELAATSSPGYIFGGWSGDATGSDNPLSVLMDANKTITANFVPDVFDHDGDGLSNHDEIVTYGTNPTLPDTDGDGLTDASEVGLGHYWIIAGAFTWEQARADARARHGELACFPTAARWNRAMESLGANALDNFTGLWIGANDAAEEGNWSWTSGEPFTFSQWATSRPSITSGNTLDYAEVSGGGGAELGKWYDRTATFLRDGYILETGYLTHPTIDDTDSDGFDDGFETNNAFNPTLASSTPEGIASLRILPGSLPPAVEFRFNAAKGVSYRIESSTDLNNWTAVETAIIGEGAAVIRSYSSGNLTQRFFRTTRN
jgi:uncharacterized repeat protein (TIGR02543 family)